MRMARHSAARWAAASLAVVAFGGGALAVGAFFIHQKGCSADAAAEIRLLKETAVSPMPKHLHSRMSDDAGCDSGTFSSISWTPVGEPARTFDFYESQGWLRLSPDALRPYGHSDAVGYSRTIPNGRVDVIFVPQGEQGFFQAALA